MKLLKHKFILLALVLQSAFILSVTLLPEHASAAALSQEIACVDGTKELSIKQDKTKGETTVKCASGAKIDYLLNTREATARATASCPDPYKVGSDVDKPNDLVSYIRYYCVSIGGRDAAGDPIATRQPKSTPAVQDTTAAMEASKAGAGTSVSTDDPTTSDDCKSLTNCGILKYVTRITNVLSGIAGLIIVSMIIIGGIQYSTAGPDPSKVQAARTKIFNALLALVFFVFGFAILQWLIPGGIF